MTATHKPKTLTVKRTIPLAVTGALLGAGLVAAAWFGLSQYNEANKPTPTSAAVLKVTDWGDIEPAKETRTAASGEYQTLAINPDSKVFKELSPETNKEETELFGFKEDQLLEAQQTVLNLTVKDIIDNPAFNSTQTEYDKWVEDLPEDYYHPDFRDRLYENPTVIPTMKNSALPQFITDGKPRATHSTIKITNLTGSEINKKPTLKITVEANTDYRVSDKELTKGVSAVTGIPEKELTPLLGEQAFDNAGENQYPVKATAEFETSWNEETKTWRTVGLSVDYAVDETFYNLPGSTR